MIFTRPQKVNKLLYYNLYLINNVFNHFNLTDNTSVLELEKQFY